VQTEAYEVINIEFTLREYQRAVWAYLAGGGKRAIINWHRRYGKDELCLRWTVSAALKRPGNYWHMLPKYEQARKAVWKAINPVTGKRRIDEIFPREMRLKTNEQDMSITIPSGPGYNQESIWQVLGSDNVDSLVGSPPVGVVHSEFALENPNAWGLIKPILEDNGGWAIFNGTPRGKNHNYRMMMHAQKDPSWFAQVLPVTTTHALSDGQLTDIKAEYISLYGAVLGQAMYDQEYLCSYEAATPGAVFGEAITKARGEGRIGMYPHDPSRRCLAAFDIGRRDATVVWVYQSIGGGYRFVHCYSMTGEAANPDKVASVLRNSPYDIAAIVLPHDARHKTASNRGVSYQMQFDQLGWRTVIADNTPIEVGLVKARQLLGQSTFDLEHCDADGAQGIEALSQYRYEYDSVKRVMGLVPVHDWCSDYSDAFRMAAVGMVKAVNYLQSSAKPININDYMATS